MPAHIAATSPLSYHGTGPFIAVDSPNHAAAIGAVRASLTDAEWQGTVLEWMRPARPIVLLAAVSHWIR
jgi:hypothetical protein